MCIVGLVEISPGMWMLETFDPVEQVIRSFEVLQSP